ncbi:hypothetical protein K474DRAFT_1656742 [Panus rudis PR-1116 ss-1]|nr:hypothetical protein K474DRAFT_1656742 [Panus rudis PR-1116 ss-1]
MADNAHYPPTNHSQYLAPANYYSAHPPPASGNLHIVQPPRPDAPQRKRPKYTRSKTGCLTCRAKKIKCDETKPKCVRCIHGQRECTWPEGVPTRKKSSSRRGSQHDDQQSTTPLDSPVTDARPSTAGSSTISDASTSTPPTRNPTPPRRDPQEVSLPPLISRRSTQSIMQVPHGASDMEAPRRQQLPQNSTHGYASAAAGSQILPAIPEMSSQQYASHSSYHQQYQQSHYGQGQSLSSSRVSAQYDHTPAVRSVDSASSGQWSSHSSLDSLDQYYPSTQERGLVGHSSHTHVRY